MRSLLLLVLAILVNSLCGCNAPKPQTNAEEFQRYGFPSEGEANCSQSRLSPCRTERSHSYSIRRGTFGVLDAEIYSREDIFALAADDSTSVTIVETWKKHWIFPERRRNVTVLLLRSTNQIVGIDHIHRVFTVSTGANRRGVPGWQYFDDPDCSKFHPHILNSQERVPDSTIAGIPVIGYYWRDEEESTKTYFAPSMGCAMLRSQSIHRNFLWIPTGFSKHEADSLVLGPPDKQLFTIPKDYKDATGHPPSTFEPPRPEDRP